MNTKKCSKCLLEKTLDQFRKGGGKFGKKAYCLPCDDEYNNQLYKKKKELRKRQITEWNKENPEKLKEYAKNWRIRQK